MSSYLSSGQYWTDGSLKNNQGITASFTTISNASYASGDFASMRYCGP